MHPRARAGIVVACTIAMVLAMAPGARAHASLVSSSPASGEQVSDPPSEIVLHFSEDPDIGAGTTVEILDTTGQRAGGPVRAAPGDPRALTVPFIGRGTAVYTVTWRVLSRADGHVTVGAYAFGVGVSPAGVVVPPARATSSATPFSGVARWLVLVGIALLIGSGWMGLRAFVGTPPHAVGVIAWIGIASAASGSLALAEAQRRAAGVDWSGFRSTALYGAALQRVAVVAVAAAVMLVLPRLRNAVALLAGCALGIAHVMHGHAGAGDRAVLTIAAQGGHVIAVGVWIGGLVVLLATLRSTDPATRGRVVRTFSRAALWSVIVVAATGSLRALNEVGSVDRLSTRYGVFVLTKVGLLLALIGLGAMNRFRHAPTASSEPGRLRRIVRAEIGVAAIVLAVTAVMAATTPPRSSRAEGPPAVEASGADFATTTRARLTASPGIAGVNRFEIALRGYDAGTLIVGATVRARFTYRGGGDAVTTTTLELAEVRSGVYAAQGANLALPGPWEVAIEVTRGTDVATIDLAIATRSAQPPRATRLAGQPTVYDVSLASGASVQFYVDPGRAGRNEVHATFFDASGAEAKGLADLVMTSLGPDGSIGRLPIRMLSVGHLIADATLATGRWRFDVFARASDGARLSGSFDEIIR